MYQSIATPTFPLLPWCRLIPSKNIIPQHHAMFAEHSFEVGTYVLFFISFLTPSHAVATCYREDTHAAMDTIYTPCNSNQPFSMCYRSQPDIYGAPPDYACLPNGITLQNNTRWGIAYWRQSCTDPTWQSPYCLNAFNECAAVSFRTLSRASRSPVCAGGSDGKQN
jgi:hypothetical protein